MKNNSNLSYSNQRIRQVSEPGYMQANAYLVRSPEGCVLVDPGSGVQTGFLLDALTDEGLSLADVDAVLLTHYHCDHALIAYWYHERGIPVWASRHTAKMMERGDARIWAEHADLIQPCPIDRVIEDGEHFSVGGLEFNALATPGHTRGCMTFILDTEEGQTALCGDVLLSNGQPGWAGDEYDPDLLLQTLTTLADRPLDAAYGGHGIVKGNVREWLLDGIKQGQNNQWNPPTHWQAQDVPDEIKNPPTFAAHPALSTPIQEISS